jgi:hypothetical protein
MPLTDKPRIVFARKPRPARPPKPTPIAVIVYNPSPKRVAALRRWEQLTERMD